MGFAQSDVTATLKVASFGGDAQGTAIKSAVARFNKTYPNVTAELAMDPISTGWGDCVTKVLSQFISGETADICGTAIETLRAFASRGLWLPQDDFIKADTGVSDFAPSLLEQGSYKGNADDILIGWNTIMFNCNRDLFGKAGIAYPVDWTCDRFRDAARKLTVKDGSGNVTQSGYAVPNQNFFIQPWRFLTNTSALNADWTASNMLDPKVAESLQFLHDLIHVDRVSPIPGNDTTDNLFLAGQVAMISRGPWITENVKNAKLNMDIANVRSKLAPTTVIGFGGYAINKATANADPANALVLELTSVETQTEEGAGGGGVPGRARRRRIPLPSSPSRPRRSCIAPACRTPGQCPRPRTSRRSKRSFIRYHTAMISDEVSIADGCKQANDALNASFDRLKQNG